MTQGKVSGVVANLVSVEVDGPVAQNEICHIEVQDVHLMAEVIRIHGNTAHVQVFESTRGLRVGASVKFSGHMLEIDLGPGILSRKYDGLQNDLEKMSGIFLSRGTQVDALDPERRFDFTPIAKVGDSVRSADWLGQVKENWMDHKIMVPFALEGSWTVADIQTGSFRVDDTVATLKNSRGETRAVTMRQKWPIKKAIQAFDERPRPYRLMETGIRVIDTLNPLVEGGTGFIPGPFGCGKTVLQHAMSKNAHADLIIITACGERANEVVEIFKEFPHLDDPRTGRKLMERTTIICNTSNMPVAAREASVYTGMTIAEYYRSMGLRVLLLADSTSRWAQALREMSNRLEELPGPDAFPMDLSAIISNFYARAGYVRLRNGQTGSVTFVGTVSPAGGNLKEPVTESTRKAARAFYALSQGRADARRYPAIDPLDSYSKYLEYPEFVEYMGKELRPDWTSMVTQARDILRQGQEAQAQINILGDDSVPLEYHEVYWKGEMIDFVILQQDAFDAVDASTPLARQQFMLELLLGITRLSFSWAGFEAVGNYYKQLINILKQMNYAVMDSPEFSTYLDRLRQMLREQSGQDLAADWTGASV
ncbi:MAG: V-type ATP synthase subunit A [Spirochaetales bacterium]|nr:V-type ATP synthase subunit A [Spirochaetales bacterium]